MKSLISDFDGTLFFNEEDPHVRIEDVKKIHQFQKENVFGLCTGRPLCGVIDLETFDLHCDFYIVTSGALIVDKNFEIIYEKTMSHELIQTLIEETKGVHRAIQTKGNVYPVDEPLPYPMKQVVISSVDEVNEPILGMSLMAKTDNEAYELVKQLNAKYEITALQNQNCVDIVPKGCSKGNAVQFMKQHLGLSHIAAIGDSYNDMDMLETADDSFTFFNSPKSVQNVSKHLVSNIKEAIEILL